MKTIKLLAALAMPAMFAACTNEEILDETPIQGQEIVGAELVGTDISINVGLGGAESRFNGGWELTDNLGLAWSTVGAYNSQQNIISNKKVTTPTDEIVANHMFARPDLNSSFSTKGNIYKGWHFAYYPYGRMDKIGIMENVELNPEQKDAWSAVGGARFNGRLAISARRFLTSDNLDPLTNQLNKGVDFNVEWATNDLAIHLTPIGNFVTNKHLNDLSIQSIELKDASSNKKYFASTATINASKIPTLMNKSGNSIYGYGEKDQDVDVAKTKQALLDAIPAIVSGNYTNSIKTKIGIDMKTATGGSTRIFVLPYVKNGEITPIELNPIIKVEVEGGYFEIKKVDNAEEGSYAALNNEQLDKLIADYAEDGKFTDAQNIGSNRQLYLNLYPEIFHPYFDEIDNYEEWKQCVNIVTALGFTHEQTFNITGDIEVNSTTISLPKNCKVTVTGDKDIVINKKLKSWPAADKFNVEAVDVVFNENNTISQDIDAQSIVNNATMTIAAGTAETPNYLDVATITNNGTIIVDKYAKVGPAVDNTNGRIEIIYGGIAETSVEGVIYYTVLGTEPAYKLNNLMTEGNVNTFVVNNGITLDVNKTYVSGALDDEYIPTPGSSDPIDAKEFEQVTVELNGGSVIGLKNSVQSKVAEIKVISSETNLITDLKAGLITATAGTLTMDATTYLVGTTLHKYELDMKAATTVDVKAGATLIANANTHVNVLDNAGTVKANAGYLFHYNSGVNNGTLTGEVEKCDCVVTPEFTELENAVKVEWDEWKTAAVNVGKTFDQSYVTNLINSLTVADLTDNKKNSAKFYNVLKNWFEAKGMTIMSTSTFDGTDIIGFNYANEGTTNDLAY